MKHIVLRLFPVLLLAFFASSCGVDPVAGLEGEYCTMDDDCCEDLICERNVCLPIALFGGGTGEREGLFFVVANLTDWEGTMEENNLRAFGEFVSQLSVALDPYYALYAVSEEEVQFGLVDYQADPLMLDDSYTITSMPLSSTGSYYQASGITILMPMYYEDDTTQMQFELPLMGSEVYLYLPDVTLGTGGEIELSGYLRAEDSLELEMTQPEGTFSLFDVFQGIPMDVDSNEDGVNDSWTLHWSGSVEVR